MFRSSPPQIPAPSRHPSPAGHWSTDEAGLPCWELTAPRSWHPYTPLKHLMATGRLSAFADRWGNFALFTTEGGEGLQHLAENKHQSRSALYPMLRRGDEPVSLIYDELTGARRARYGCGYAEYEGETAACGTRLRVRQRVVAPPGGERFLLGFIRLENLGATALEADLLACADFSSADPGGKSGRILDPEVAPGCARLAQAHPVVGDLYLVGAGEFSGKGVSWTGIGLEQAVEIAAGAGAEFAFAVGYGDPADAAAAQARIARTGWTRELENWRRKLAPADLPAAPEAWIRAECLWTAGQFLAFKNYSSYLDEHYISLGGYGWGGCNQREFSENAIGLSQTFPDEAEGNLRWTTKSQFTNGDLPHAFNPKPPKVSTPPDRVGSSDTEPWYLLALLEHARTERGRVFLDSRLPYADGPEASVWEHAVAAFRWIRDRIGLGRHGLVKSHHGDWNDYLFPMGAGGEGESMMNTGIAARAYDLLVAEARRRGEPALAEEAASARDALRAAAGAAFDQTHFPRGFTDTGRPVGSTADDRCFINAQSWAALGGCGSPGQRETALRHALGVNRDPRGLTLVSRPFPSPPPADVSSLPIAAGEGENGGVWPQAVAWFIWALAEEGLSGEALDVWKRMSFRHAAEIYPGTPFGLFNGPDCYNSHLAGDLAHWTQVQLWDRRVHTPMNPSVAWHHFAMAKILASKQP
ncbi:MAG: GH36-type glycosyl hydrolase domain-containing protein [Puniceicoccaceae bacterium]